MAVPVAAFLALVFRFPGAFVGYASGPRAVLPAIGSVFVWMLSDPFLVLVLLGAITGAIVACRVGGNSRRASRLTALLCLLIVTVAGLVVSVLDKIVRPR
jgi:hypothetical protein